MKEYIMMNISLNIKYYDFIHSTGRFTRCEQPQTNIKGNKRKKE